MWFPASVWFLTVLVLVLVVAAPGLAGGGEQFEDKGWAARLVAYPFLMLIAPVAWWAARRGTGQTPPYAAFGLMMMPFLSDTAANWLDLFRTVAWWDDVSHAAHWFLLCSGIGLLLRPHLGARWMVVLVVTGAGALLALGWELGEWWLFIRHGTESRGAYQDTLGDETLGVTGALVASLLVAVRGPGRSTSPAYSPQT